MDANKKSFLVNGVLVVVVFSIGFIGYKSIRNKAKKKESKEDELNKDLDAYKTNPNSTLGEIGYNQSWFSWLNPFK